jgi:primosomal replication protein N
LTLSPTSAFGIISGTTSIPVTIVSGTEVKSGTSITAGATVRVRGLIFFNATGNTYSMIAARIDSNN